MGSTLVLWNPKAGRVDEAQALQHRLERSAEITFVPTTSREDASRRAREAAAEGFDRVVTAGGDGSINAVVNGLIQAPRRIEMGILPLGTANDFAYTLAIPDDLEQAADLLMSGQVRPIDIVEFETKTQRRCFANVAAGGNSDRVTKQLSDQIKQRWGALSYLRGAAEVVTDLVSFDTVVSIDEGPPLRESLWNVVIANGRTNGGRLPVAPHADPEDGLLDVILIRDGGFLDLAELTLEFTVTDYLESEHVIYRQARSLTFESTPRMEFSFDGEAIDEQPVVFRCLPKAIPMVVGKAYRPAGDET